MRSMETLRNFTDASEIESVRLDIEALNVDHTIIALYISRSSCANKSIGHQGHKL
ncbi:hypothetical protein D3C78_1887390 [compost metagenome]